MKYTIEGFSQEGAIELGLDVTDLVILRWIVDFYHTESMEKRKIGNKIYFWVNYETLIEELPMLRIKKDSLYRRLIKMCEKGVLEHATLREGGTFSMYRLGEKYAELISDTLRKKIRNPSGNKSVPPTEKNPEQISIYNNNSSIKEKNPLSTKEGGGATKKKDLQRCFRESSVCSYFRCTQKICA